MNSEFPLSWPPGFPHIEYPAQSRFDTPEERVRRNLELPLDLMDAVNVVEQLRAAQPRPAVFQPKHHGLGCGLFHNGKAASRPSLATNGTLSATTSKP